MVRDRRPAGLARLRVAIVDRRCRASTTRHTRDVSSSEERLAAAVHRGDVDAVRAALSEGADPNGPGRWCMGLLECAVADGRVEVMRVLLEAGADPNAASEVGSESLLRAAVQSAQVEAVRVLVEFGAGADP